MADLERTRTSGDRRLYALEGIGTLRLEGSASRRATAVAGSTSWRIARRGFLGRRIEATDDRGTLAGEFEPRTLRRGGTLRWGLAHDAAGAAAAGAGADTSGGS